ncbi:MAG: hypothetical protein WB611_13925 [Stellaceae bacterium]
MTFGIGNGGRNRNRHRFGDLVLDGEDVGEIAIVPLSRRAR